MFPGSTRRLLMGYPTQGQTHKLIEQLEKNIDMLDNELISIKSMLVTQTIQLKELNEKLKEWIVNNEQ